MAEDKNKDKQTKDNPQLATSKDIKVDETKSFKKKLKAKKKKKRML